MRPGRWSPSKSCSMSSRRPRPGRPRAKPKLELSDFQPLERDFAFIVDHHVKAGDLIKAAQGADRQADRRCRRVRSLRRAGCSCGQEVGGDQCDPSAPRKDPDRRRRSRPSAAKIVAEVAARRPGATLRG